MITTQILDNGCIRLVDENNHIIVLSPAQDVSLFPPDIQKLCEKTWTADVVDSYLNGFQNISQSKVKSVTMRQARLALLNTGLLDAVNSAITSGDDVHKIEWEFAATIDRNSPLVISLSSGLGLTEDQVDSLFLEASRL